VALGSGFHPALSPTLSMQAVIALACMRSLLAAEEAIAAATINAAHALRCADRTGSLEYGKAADLVMLDTSDFRDLGHHLGHNLVAMTIKRGRIIYQQGEVQRTLWDALEPTA
jgi:imidazolonepropionase